MRLKPWRRRPRGSSLVIADLSTVRPSQSASFEVSGDDWESLLVNWLNDLLYRFDVDHLLFCQFSVAEVTSTHLLAIARGEPYDSARHRLLLGVKAATYHQVSVVRGDEVVLRVILDV